MPSLLCDQEWRGGVRVLSSHFFIPIILHSAAAGQSGLEESMDREAWRGLGWKLPLEAQDWVSDLLAIAVGKCLLFSGSVFFANGFRDRFLIGLS